MSKTTSLLWLASVAFLQAGADEPADVKRIANAPWLFD